MLSQQLFFTEASHLIRILCNSARMLEQCWCGDEGTDHLKHGASEMCDFECEGNVNEICGGRWSMSVYEN